MNMTETLLNISRDLGDVKAGVASLHEKVDHQPDVIRLAIKEHEDDCRLSKTFVTVNEIPQILEKSSTDKMTKIKAILYGAKEIMIIAIAVITGKIL